MDDQQERAHRNRCHRREALDRIVVEIAVDRRAGGERAGRGEQQRVAVRIGGRDRLGADGAAGSARAVLDDDRLPECHRQTVGDQAGDHVGAARRERHDHLDDAARVGLRNGGAGRERAEARRQDRGQDRLLAAHGVPSLVLAFMAALRLPVFTVTRCAGWAKARPSSPQRRRGRMDAAAFVDEAVRPVAGEQSGPSRSTTRARCATSIAGAMASEVATMQPTMSAKPSRSASCAMASASVSPPALVELDVDRVVFSDQRRERSEAMHALVGADRQRPAHVARAHRRGRRAAAARPA